MYHCQDSDCPIITHEGEECPMCGGLSMSEEDADEGRREAEAAAYDEYRAHGLPDDATHDPYTGWSEYDYPSRGSSRNDAGEPYLD